MAETTTTTDTDKLTSPNLARRVKRLGLRCQHCALEHTIVQDTKQRKTPVACTRRIVMCLACVGYSTYVHDAETGEELLASKGRGAELAGAHEPDVVTGGASAAEAEAEAADDTAQDTESTGETEDDAAETITALALELLEQKAHRSQQLAEALGVESDAVDAALEASGKATKNGQGWWKLAGGDSEAA